MEARTLGELQSIQTLRGAAALAVCLAHLHAVEAKFGGKPLLGSWALSGFAGVDLFFVISGFVMVWVTRGTQGVPGAVPAFWFSRAARIYPLWWLVLGAIFAVWLVRPDWVYASHTTNPDILRSFFLLPAQGFPLHAVGWTLIHELWFYLVFGLLLILPERALPWCLGLWAGIVTAAAIAVPNPNNPWLDIMRHPLTLEFILGACVGLLAKRGWFPACRHMLQFGLFWMLLSVLSIRENPPATFEAEWERILKFGVPSALVVWGWVGLEKLGGTTPRWSIKLGDWSYALYLIHVPVFAALGRLAAPVSQPGALDNIVLLAVALAAAITAAFLLHVGFERPILRVTHWVRAKIKP